MVYSTTRFVLCLTFCHFVLVFFSPFSIAITSLGEQRANLNVFCRFIRFLFLLVSRKGLRFVNVALPGLFSYPFMTVSKKHPVFFYKLPSLLLVTDLLVLLFFLTIEDYPIL